MTTLLLSVMDPPTFFFSCRVSTCKFVGRDNKKANEGTYVKTVTQRWNKHRLTILCTPLQMLVHVVICVAATTDLTFFLPLMFIIVVFIFAIKLMISILTARNTCCQSHTMHSWDPFPGTASPIHKLHQMTFIGHMIGRPIKVRQSLAVGLSKTLGGNYPRLFSQLGSCNDPHE